MSTTLLCPFGARTVAIEAPSYAAPGQPIQAMLVVRNETDGLIADAFFAVELSPGLRALGAIGGESAVGAGIQQERLRRGWLPPLHPGDAWETPMLLQVDAPAKDGSRVVAQVSVGTSSGQYALSHNIVVRSQAAFNPRTTLVTLGSSDAAIGEEISGTLIVTNEGTASADGAHLAIHARDLEVVGLALDEALAPCAPRRVPFRALVTGHQPELQVAVTWNSGRFDLPPSTIVAVDGPRLGGTLALAGEDRLPPEGGIVSLALSVSNGGARPARNASAYFALPSYAKIQGSPDGIVALPDLAPGETCERAVLMAVDPGPPFEVVASLRADRADEADLGPALIEIDAVRSLAVHQMEIDRELRVGETALCAAMVVHDGNLPIDAATIELTLGPHLEVLPFSARVNGRRVAATSSLRLRDISPGAAIAISWEVVARRATVRGATTSVSVGARWGTGYTAASSGPLSIAPQPQTGDNIGFTIDEELLSDEDTPALGSGMLSLPGGPRAVAATTGATTVTEIAAETTDKEDHAPLTAATDEQQSTSRAGEAGVYGGPNTATPLVSSDTAAVDEAVTAATVSDDAAAGGAAPAAPADAETSETPSIEITPLTHGAMPPAEHAAASAAPAEDEPAAGDVSAKPAPHAEDPADEVVDESVRIAREAQRRDVYVRLRSTGQPAIAEILLTICEIAPASLSLETAHAVSLLRARALAEQRVPTSFLRDTNYSGFIAAAESIVPTVSGQLAGAFDLTRRPLSLAASLAMVIDEMRAAAVGDRKSFLSATLRDLPARDAVDGLARWQPRLNDLAARALREAFPDLR